MMKCPTCKKQYYCTREWMALHIGKHGITKQMVSEALTGVATGSGTGKGGPYKRTTRSEDPSLTDERSAKKSRPTSTPDSAKDDERRERVSRFLKFRYEDALKKDGTKMSSIYMVNEKDVNESLAVISKMDSMFRFRIFKHFEDDEEQSQIIRRMAVGSLHPSDLLQIVSIAEELGLMPSALIILIKEYYRLDKK